jgi:hypothetical protein
VAAAMAAETDVVAIDAEAAVAAAVTGQDTKFP